MESVDVTKFLERIAVALERIADSKSFCPESEASTNGESVLDCFKGRDIPLASLRLPKRFVINLADCDIDTVNDLLQFNRTELLKIRGIGSEGFNAIVSMLDSLGLSLPEVAKVSYRDWIYRDLPKFPSK